VAKRENIAFNNIETEVINLCIAVEALDEMINHRLLRVVNVQGTGESEVRYRSEVHQELFTILLLDFVYENRKKSCLDMLDDAACGTRSFEYNGSAALLKAPVKTLQRWLQTKMTVTLWLPSLSLNAKLTIERLDFLTISGNQSKHNPWRLTGVSDRLVRIFSDNGYTLMREEIQIALDDFREHFDYNYIAYYGTWLAEMLNNVRWGAQDYLRQESELSLKRSDGGYPKSVEHPIPRQWYDRLITKIRAKPYFERFVGSSIFKSEAFPNGVT
jgi:hypothetical protein